MSPGDLVRVAQRWIESWPNLPKPVFSEETDGYGMVIHIYPDDIDALVLIRERFRWVALKDMEVINEMEDK